MNIEQLARGASGGLVRPAAPLHHGASGQHITEDITAWEFATLTYDLERELIRTVGAALDDLGITLVT